jgi:hypothetical protein
MLAFDGDRNVVSDFCDHCGAPQTRVAGFLSRDGDAYVVYFASCYHHGQHEVWIDVIFSPTWADDVDDHYTFGCRVGPIEGQDEPAASMVDAASVRGDSTLFGRKLSRDEGLSHPQVDEFWEVVDFLLLNDPDISVHMGYAHPPRRPTVAERIRRALGVSRRGA